MRAAILIWAGWTVLVTPPSPDHNSPWLEGLVMAERQSTLFTSDAQAVCQGCGAPTKFFRSSDRAKKWCSAKCRSVNSRPLHSLTCKECQGSFASRNVDTRFCSMSCSSRSTQRDKKLWLECQHCGKRYHPKQANRCTYCSRDCAFAAQKTRALLHKEQQAADRAAREMGLLCSC